MCHKKTKSPFHTTKNVAQKRRSILRGTTLLGAMRPPCAVPIHSFSVTGVPVQFYSLPFDWRLREELSSVSHTVLHRPTALCDALRLLFPVIAFIYYNTYYNTVPLNCQAFADKKISFYTSTKRKVRNAHLSVCFDSLFFTFGGGRVAIIAHSASFTATTAPAFARTTRADTCNKDGNGNRNDHRNGNQRAQILQKPIDHCSSPILHFFCFATR